VISKPLALNQSNRVQWTSIYPEIGKVLVFRQSLPYLLTCYTFLFYSIWAQVFLQTSLSLNHPDILHILRIEWQNCCNCSLISFEDTIVFCSTHDMSPNVFNTELLSILTILKPCFGIQGSHCLIFPLTK